jgi:hypothetical protein
MKLTRGEEREIAFYKLSWRYNCKNGLLPAGLIVKLRQRDSHWDRDIPKYLSFCE